MILHLNGTVGIICGLDSWRANSGELQPVSKRKSRRRRVACLLASYLPNSRTEQPCTLSGCHDDSSEICISFPLFMSGIAAAGPAIVCARFASSRLASLLAAQPTQPVRSGPRHIKQRPFLHNFPKKFLRPCQHPNSPQRKPYCAIHLHAILICCTSNVASASTHRRTHGTFPKARRASRLPHQRRLGCGSY